MRSLVTVAQSSRQGAGFEIAIIMQNGKSIGSINAPGCDGNVAALVAQYAIEHCYKNPDGGDIVGPARILNLIPPHLRSVPKLSER